MTLEQQPRSRAETIVRKSTALFLSAAAVSAGTHYAKDAHIISEETANQPIAEVVGLDITLDNAPLMVGAVSVAAFGVAAKMKLEQPAVESQASGQNISA